MSLSFPVDIHYILLLGPGWGNVVNNPAGLAAACLGGLKPPTHYRKEKVENNSNRKVSVTKFECEAFNDSLHVECAEFI